MKTSLFSTILLVMLAASLYGQSGSINNTLGTGGSFIVKDGATTFLTLSQSTGYLGLNKSLSLPVTTASTLGVIFKGADRFIHNYQAASTSGFNTFVGVNAGNFTMSGGSLQASWNTSVGSSSLSSLTSGSENSAFGYGSLQNTTTSNGNSGFGAFTLFSNTTGAENSAFGNYALTSNTVGYANSAFGYESMVATTGFRNSAFGHQSLHFNTTGYQNSAFGTWSLYSNTGNSNTALGYYAGYDLTTGSNNTLIGFNAEPSVATVSNEITLGNSQITTLRCQATTITALSDMRDKKNIQNLPIGLDFLMTIKPRLFHWDRREWYEGDTGA